MNKITFTAIAISICLVILGSSYTLTSTFAQNSNITTLSKTDNGSSIFLFAYKNSGGLPGIDQRISFDSFTNELVSINNFPEHTYQIKTLDNSTADNLKKLIRDNNIFSTKGIYHTAFKDIPGEKLLIVLDGKLHSVELNVPGPITEQIPRELINIVDAIRNVSSFK